MLYHFSEDPCIEIFEPRKLDYRQDEAAMVWAISEARAAHYLLPRDCPRVCFWADENTTAEDSRRFFGHSSVRHVVAVESCWLNAIRSTTLYRYVFSEEGFSLYDANAGYYTALTAIKPVRVDRIDDLLAALVESAVELRITPSLMPLRSAVLSSTANFSMIRMKNAAT